MFETTSVACAVQAILAGFLAWTLSRGAQSAARRTLASVLWGLCLYALGLGLLPWVGRANANLIAVPFTVFAFMELRRFARWYANGAQIGSPPPSSTRVTILAVIPIAASCGVAAWIPTAARIVTLSAMVGLIVLSTWSLVEFSRAKRRGVASSRGYMLATAAVVLSLTSSLLLSLGAPIPRWFHALFMRDLAVLACEFLLLTSYVDSGQEPMSLRERVVSGMLMALAALATVTAHIVLPLATDASSAHTGAVRLMVMVFVATIVVVLVAPRIFRRSVLAPLDELLRALSKAEAGERVALPVDRRDELGDVARAFNTMVAGLADDRAALSARVAEIEARKTQIDGLNEELRRQIAARSRQLAQLLSRLDRGGESIQIGTVVDGRYRIDDQLGAGAMGIVFLARRLSDEKRFALKTLIGAAHDDAVRFTREAEIVATVHHPHVVSIVDVGIHQNAPFFVMEFLSQGTLADSVHRYGDFPWLLPLLEEVMSGLVELHGRGILHRDLKPANVLLDGDPGSPTAKIGDLGIARSDESAALADTQAAASGNRPLSGTAPNALLGTYPYMAPELARGAAAFEAHSDIFSFAVMAWEVCTGAVPFSVPPVVSAMAGLPLRELAPMPEGAPPDLERLLRRCLERDPSLRPRASEILTALEGIIASTPSVVERGQRKSIVLAFEPTARDLL